MLKIGNASGFWGDRPSAAAELIAQQPDIDYLTLDYLSELTMSILAVQQEKNPDLGYAHDFINTLRSLAPFWKNGLKFKIITNAGGLNPMGCAQACLEVLKDMKLKIGVVIGDNVLDQIKAPHELVTANAYLGAAPIVEALNNQADIVITGRVTDPSLTLAPCISRFGWKWDEYHKLAGGTIAGHLIECGTQVTGGISTNWEKILDPANIGYPFVEIGEHGNFVITKPSQTSGVVNFETVKEQLLYEIGDPDNFLGPDVNVSFLSLQLEEEGKNRIKLTGARGKPPSGQLKVSATYRNGYRTEGTLFIYGPRALAKAQRVGEVVIERVRKQGYSLQNIHIDCLGNDQECMLRIAARDTDKKSLECLSKELAPLVTSGPQGVSGYTYGRPQIRPVFAYWPCYIDKTKVNPKVEILN